MGSESGGAFSDTTDTSYTTLNKSTSTKKAYIAVGILFLVNLLNYIDRFTVAGVLDDIQDYYHLDKAEQVRN